MHSIVRFVRRKRAAQALALAIVLAVTTSLVASAAVSLIQISSDPFTNSDNQHKTQVEPDTFAWGSTIVAVTQSGRRFSGGGASDIGWAVSQDGGNTWTHDFLNCITTQKFNNCGTLVQYDRVSDPSVAYDPKHNVWLIATLPIKNNIGAGVLVSRSTDGGLTFGNPVTVHTSGDFHDKDWIVCDTNSNSPFYGNCYVEWDNASFNNLVQMSTSTDGGLTWGAAQTTPNNACVIGGQPLVQPNGNVVVPIDNCFEGAVLAFTSTNGGVSWNNPVTVATISSHAEAGNLRSGPLPSAEIDGDGKIYVVWQDCRFRSGCKANDIVMSTSTDGISWSAVTRIPFTKLTSTVDAFIPGIAVDITSHAPNVKIGVTAYGYRNTSCTSSTCKLFVGFVQSTNGGTSWFGQKVLAGPMTLTWLANTDQGYMVGDYISTSISGGKSIPSFELAKAPSGGVFDESLYSVQGGLSFPTSGEQFSGLGDQPVPNAHSDHALPTRPINTIQPIQ